MEPDSVRQYMGLAETGFPQGPVLHKTIHSFKKKIKIARKVKGGAEISHKVLERILSRG
jgi:hypothetical protein